MALEEKLGNIQDLSGAMLMLLEALSYDRGHPENMDIENNVDEMSGVPSNVSHLFGSQLGISMISMSVTQITHLRFSICRNLLILQQMIHSSRYISETSTLPCYISADVSLKTIMMAQAYHVIMWICDTNASYASVQTLSCVCRAMLSFF